VIRWPFIIVSFSYCSWRAGCFDECVGVSQSFLRFHCWKWLAFTVTNIQFANDTINFVWNSWPNIRAIKTIMWLFELMSGLKVNFHKSMLLGVNVADSSLEEASLVLDWKNGKTRFYYLGLPIEGNHRIIHFWKPMIGRIKSHPWGVAWFFSKFSCPRIQFNFLLLRNSHMYYFYYLTSFKSFFCGVAMGSLGRSTWFIGIRCA
jgi:hypothetical protein